MCSETDFTQGKSHFHPTSRIPNSPLWFAAALREKKWYFYGQAFYLFTLDYDYTCSEMDFIQGKSHFHPTTRIPNSSYFVTEQQQTVNRIAV